MLKLIKRLPGRSRPRTATLLLSGAFIVGCEPQGPEVASPSQSTGVTEPTRTALAEPRAEPPAPGEIIARAELEPAAGHAVTGIVELTPGPDGELAIMARLEGLEPGPHGFHVHEIGDCSAPETSAGEHFAPDGDLHGAPEAAPDGHHAGDLGNVMADASGTVQTRMSDDELELTGRYGVVDRAIVVHASEDDLTSQPSGESGDPVACGVIELVSREAESTR